MYQEEIEPLWAKLAAACKKHNVCAISAFSVPITQNAGVIMLHVVPSADNTVPPPFHDAYQIIAKGSGTPPAPTAPATGP